MKKLVLFSLILITCASASWGGGASAPSDATSVASIADLMSAKEFGTWVQARERQAAVDQAAGVEHTVQSQIDGDFDGWEGETMFKLANGQVWQQSRPSARYHFANSPKVTISTTYKMKVEGVAGEVSVRRIR
jgi:hypothetical protein